MRFSFLLVLELLLVLGRLNSLLGVVVPVLRPRALHPRPPRAGNGTEQAMKYLTFSMLIPMDGDTSEFWRKTDLLSLVREQASALDPEECRRAREADGSVHFPSRRTVRPICRAPGGKHGDVLLSLVGTRASALDPEECRRAREADGSVHFPSRRTVRPICRAPGGKHGDVLLSLVGTRASALDPEECRRAREADGSVHFPSRRTVRPICRAPGGKHGDVLLSLVGTRASALDPEECRRTREADGSVHFPSRRTVRPICRAPGGKHGDVLLSLVGTRASALDPEECRRAREADGSVHFPSRRTVRPICRAPGGKHGDVLLSLVGTRASALDPEECRRTREADGSVHFPSRRTVRPICRAPGGKHGDVLLSLVGTRASALDPEECRRAREADGSVHFPSRRTVRPICRAPGGKHGDVLLSLVGTRASALDPEECRRTREADGSVHFPSRRTVRPICRAPGGKHGDVLLSLVGTRASALDPEECRRAREADGSVHFPRRRTVRPICRAPGGKHGDVLLSLVGTRASALDPEECRRTREADGSVHFPSRRTVRPICRAPGGKHGDVLLSLVGTRASALDPEECRRTREADGSVHFPSRRTVRPICRAPGDHQLCPQCSFFSNFSECELFRDSCKERKVLPGERVMYCERKYGRWRAMLVPADYSACRCCDECVFYRELDQSCIPDEYSFDFEEFLPVISIDFRAGCNPYWGHPEQEIRALKCDQILRRCVPVSAPAVPKESLLNRNFRYEPPAVDKDCPFTCRGYECTDGKVKEPQCAAGAFLPDRNTCNCCGRCSPFQQLNEKCAEFKKTVHDNNGTKEIEVEEEFLEPGCDDGLVCRQGRCQDIHAVKAGLGTRHKRDEEDQDAKEPCKRELKFFKKKYGEDGHLHYDAPQCTPLWLYAPVQCRRFVCYCALEDGTFIKGIKVPRVEVSSMNCDCAREKCRTHSVTMECDGYGNYKSAVFMQYAATFPTSSPEPSTWQPTASPSVDTARAPVPRRRPTRCLYPPDCTTQPQNMPNIINEVKLDFKDVLLRPKRSTLRSRNDVDLYREIVFRNSGQTYRGVPVMASNMDTVGTFEMAQELAKVVCDSCQMTDVPRSAGNGFQHGHRRHLRDGPGTSQGSV
ncbi:hypothetical protein O0L34_g10053 [Tuta absoluta]|nr:hypothetical protein O0L34_g10053 [Tuta absoluta]